MENNKKHFKKSEANKWFSRNIENLESEREDEIISLDYKNAPYPTTLNDLKFLWRKRLKLSTLSIYVDKKEDQINKTQKILNELKIKSPSDEASLALNNLL